MTREEIENQIKLVCPNGCFSQCAFIHDAIAFIDVSPRSDGSRGIAFFGDKMVMNFSGSTCEILYKDIRSVELIESFENNFADELIVSGYEFEVRISDYSLDKSALKNLIEELCKSGLDNAENNEIPEENARKLPEDFSEDIPEEVSEEISEKIFTKASENNFIEEQAVLNDNAEISVWEKPIISAFVEDNAKFTAVKVLPPKVEEKPKDEIFSVEVVEKSGNSEEIDDDFDEIAELERISNMSHEQTVSYLADAFAEINGGFSEKNPDENEVLNAKFEAEENIEDKSAVEMPREPETAETLTEQKNNEPVISQAPKGESGLSTEPIWGDIYIKASRSLRELCESGKLSMKQIEQELREKLLPSAQAFARITADETKIPKSLLPRITELRNAAKNFDEYFACGEDIGTRAMFFMLYQMLSYADRIVENPEAKEGLNDFFRRFGAAGITLSMLDMRV